MVPLSHHDFLQDHIKFLSIEERFITVVLNITGTTNQERKHSPQFERLMSQDGASSDESDSITREEDAEGAEQDISSLEFDIPKDTGARSKRILDVGKPTRQSQKQANPDEHKSESEGENKEPYYFDL